MPSIDVPVHLCRLLLAHAEKPTMNLNKHFEARAMIANSQPKWAFLIGINFM